MLRAPRSMPGSRANLADLSGGVRLPLQAFVLMAVGQSPPGRDPCVSLERNHNPTTPCNYCCRTGGSHFVRIQTNRRIGAKRAPISSAAVQAASFELRAQSQILAGAAEDGYGGKR